MPTKQSKKRDCFALTSFGLAMSAYHSNMDAREETKVGNPSFLKAMLEAQSTAMQWASERRKLLGLDQPQKFKVQFPTLAEIEGMTDDQLVDTVVNGAFANSDVAKKLKEMFLIMPGGNGNGKGNGNSIN